MTIETLNAVIQEVQELSCTHEEVGIALTQDVLQSIQADVYLQRSFSMSFGGNFVAKLYGFDVYLILDEEARAAAPIVISERYSRDIKYKPGTLVARAGEVLIASKINGDDFLLETGRRIDYERRRISLPRSIVGEEPPGSHQWYFSHDPHMAPNVISWDVFPMKQKEPEWGPTPELDEMLREMTRKTE